MVTLHFSFHKRIKMSASDNNNSTTFNCDENWDEWRHMTSRHDKCRREDAQQVVTHSQEHFIHIFPSKLAQESPVTRSFTFPPPNNCYQLLSSRISSPAGVEGTPNIDEGAPLNRHWIQALCARFSVAVDGLSVITQDKRASGFWRRRHQPKHRDLQTHFVENSWN